MIKEWLGIGQPPLPNYDQSRAERGFVPWRRFDNTEQWFISVEATPALSANRSPLVVELPLVDPDPTESLRPTLSASQRWAALGAAASLAVVIAVACFHSREPSPVAPAASPVAAAPATPPAAVVSAPATLPPAHRAGKLRHRGRAHVAHG